MAKKKSGGVPDARKDQIREMRDKNKSANHRILASAHKGRQSDEGEASCSGDWSLSRRYRD